jgi:O-antigen/teichoic acid export membrane protein
MGLKQKTLTGFLWSSAGTLGNGIISLIVTMILARILTPSDFALIALLQVFLTISNVVVDSGFSQAIIRDDNPSKTDLSSVFYFNILLSLTIYIILYLLAPKISLFYDSPELIKLSRVVFLVIIFNSFSLIQNATLNRNLNFATLNKCSVLGSLFAGVISIIMAFSGLGIWALVANSVLLPFFRSILLWYYSKWRPIINFSFKSIKRYLGFGIFLMFQGVIDAISTNLITLVIGKVYTKNELGYYSQGKKLDGYIVTPFNTIIQKVTYPILAKIKNEETRIKDAYRQIVGVVMFAFIPVMLFTIFTSKNMIIIFFGDQWGPAGIYLKIVAISQILFPLQIVCTNVVMLKGKTNIMLYFSFIKHGLRIGLVFAFINHGVLYLAIVFALSTIIGSILFIVLGMKLLKYSFSELIKDLYKTIISSFISITIVGLVGYLLSASNTIVIFIIQAIVMSLIYILFSIILKDKSLKELISLIKTTLSIILSKTKTLH